MQAVYPHMKAAGWGRIVNFASAAGITGMRGLRRVQRVEGGDPRADPHGGARVGRDGIVVNCIAPGAASKRGQERRRATTEAYRAVHREHPMGRQGDPEDDIGPVALFLCSDACRYLTGQTFMVDGGAFLFA